MKLRMIFVLSAFCAFAHAAPPIASAPPTPLVTGNGFGFGVYSLTDFALTKFYAHPYRFTKPDPSNIWGEGIEVTNFIQRMGWASETSLTSEKVQYENQSHVIDVNHGSYYFMPFGLNRTALATISKKQECLSVSWNNAVVSQKTIANTNEHFLLLNFNGVTENLLIMPLTAGGNAAFDANSCLQGGMGWIFISIDNPADVNAVISEVQGWRAGLSPEQILSRELLQMESWRVQPDVKFRTDQERKLFRQSETILRMAQSREPSIPGRNNNGLILASLPEGMWFVSWVRDMAYSTMALIRMGHQAEARSAVLAYFNAQPTGKMQAQVNGFPYQVSMVRYFGDGSEEPFFTMEGTWNIEYDNWGHVLWVLSEYVNHYHDVSILQEQSYRGQVYDVARDFIVTPLLGNMENTVGNGEIVIADTSIWENYQWAKQHFAFSTAAAINGLRKFSDMSLLVGDWQTRATINSNVARLLTGFNSAFVHDGFIVGTRERGHIELYDSAVLETVNYGVVTDRNVIQKTILEMEHLKMPSGGYRRVRGDTDYQKQEFLYSNFSLARNYGLLGEAEKGYPLIDEMVGKAIQDHGLIPEMYVSEINKQFVGNIGDPTGSIPMVGYGAGYYVIYILDR